MEINVHNVLEPLHENNEQWSTYEDVGHALCRPWGARMASPCCPEEAYRKNHRTDYHRWESVLWFDATPRSSFDVPLEGSAGVVDNEDDRESYPNREAKERQSGDLGLPSAHLLEGDGEALEEEEKNSVYEGHVDCDNKVDRLSAKEDLNERAVR